MLFKLKPKVGVHIDGKRVLKPGDTIESERDLVKAFKGKFDLVNDGGPGTEGNVQTEPNIPLPIKKGAGGASVVHPPQPIPPPAPESVKAKKNAKTLPVPPELKAAKDMSYLGREVTKKFSIADGLGVRIFHKLGSYVVVDAQDGEVLNQEKLKLDDVGVFLDSLSTDDDEGEEEVI